MKTRSKILLGTAAFLIVLVLSLGISFSGFYYLSLAGVDGIEVREMGMVDERVVFHDPMPVRYRLAREAYAIDLKLDYLKIGSPAVWIKVTSETGASLTLEQRPGDRRCDDWYFSSNFRQYVYKWSSMEHCLIEGEEAVERQVIGLVVHDEVGHVIGEENLPFEIVRNGTIIWIDSI